VACSRVRGAHPSPPDKMIPNTQQRGYWVCCCFRCLARRRPSAQRACPSGVLGPVLKPPCIRHRPLRGRLCSRSQTAGAWQGRPDRVFAPQRGRSRFGVTLSRRSSTSNSRQGVKPLPKASAMASSTVSRRVSIGHNPISRVWTGDNIRQPRLSPRQAAQDRRCGLPIDRQGFLGRIDHRTVSGPYIAFAGRPGSSDGSAPGAAGHPCRQPHRVPARLCAEDANGCGFKTYRQIFRRPPPTTATAAVGRLRVAPTAAGQALSGRFLRRLRRNLRHRRFAVFRKSLCCR
jgi:hypothetical protein